MESQARHEKAQSQRYCNDESQRLGLQQQPLQTFLFLYPFLHPMA